MADTTGTNTAADLAGGESGRDIFKAFLRQYGLGALADDDNLWNATKAKSEDEWMIDIEKTPTYQTRFKGIVELKAKAAAGQYVPHIPSVQEYVTLEAQYEKYARDYELPTNFWDDPTDFAKLIVGGVSPDEYQNRLKMAQTAALGSDPTFREELARLVPGASVGDLTAFFLDPAKGDEVLNQRYAQAQFGAASRRSDFGVLSLQEIEALQGKVTLEQAEAGFNMVNQAKEITGAIAGEQEPGMDRDRQLSLVAGEGAAEQEFKRRQRQRTARFEGGGGFAEGKEGVSGLGQGG